MAMSDDFRVAARRTYEPSAKTALAAAIVGLLLLWPFGLLLGPLALWSGISAQRRLQASGGKLAGSGPAVAGVRGGAGGWGLAMAVVFARMIRLPSTLSRRPSPRAPDPACAP